MEIPVPGGQIRHALHDVAAVVRRPLQVRQHVRPHEAQLHGPLPRLRFPDAPGPQPLPQAVDDLFQGLHLPQGGGVLPAEGRQRQVRDLLHRLRQHPELPPVLRRQLNFPVPQLLPAFQQVHGVISQAFKVPDQHQQLRRPGAVPAGQGPSAQPHQKRAQGVLQAVDALLLPPQLPGRVGVHLRQGLNPPAQVVPGQVRHFQGQLPAPFQGRRRSRQQTGIRFRGGRLLSGQQPQHRPLQQARRRKQRRRTQ